MKIRIERMQNIHNVPAHVKGWNTILRILRNYTTPVSYDTWLRPLLPVSIDEERKVLIVKADNDFSFHVVKDRYMSLIQDIAESVLGAGYRVSILNDEYLKQDATGSIRLWVTL